MLSVLPKVVSCDDVRVSATFVAAQQSPGVGGPGGGVSVLGGRGRREIRNQPPESPGWTNVSTSWVGWGWVGLGGVGLGWVGLGWVGLGWVGLGWVGLGWVGLG